MAPGRKKKRIRSSARSHDVCICMHIGSAHIHVHVHSGRKFSVRASRRAGGYMRVATVLLALALAAARPYGSASDRRALEALEARDQRAFELAIAPNRTRLQTIGKCSTDAAGGPPSPSPPRLPELLAILGLHPLKCPVVCSSTQRPPSLHGRM